MKEEYIRNGIIYIKRGPRPFHLKEAQHEEMMKELKEEIESGESEELSKEQLEDLKQFKLIEGLPDYSGCDNFWLGIQIPEGGEYLIEQTRYHFEPASIKAYKTEELREKDFISLTDFLKQATFVGRHFRRTEPMAFTGDNSFRDNGDTIVALYRTDTLLLVKRNVLGEEHFEMISPRFLNDGHYEFYGEVDPEFMYPEDLCQAIINQLVEYQKEKDKMKKGRGNI